MADGQWHILTDDLVVGPGHAGRWPDGRTFVSIDAWHTAAFDRLAGVMLTDLPAPLYTLVSGPQGPAAAAGGAGGVSAA